MNVPPNGFISYAHDDYDEFKEFRAHLRATERRFGIAFWADPSLNAGHHWDAEIARHIDAANVFVMLVSARFIESDYIYTREKPAIETRCAAVKGLILPVVLNRCAWSLAAGVLQAVPTDRGRLKPIMNWRPGRNVELQVPDPKPRLDSAEPFCDRVVYHALCAVVERLFDRGFIFHSYANRAGKGAHRVSAFLGASQAPSVRGTALNRRDAAHAASRSLT